MSAVCRIWCLLSTAARLPPSDQLAPVLRGGGLPVLFRLTRLRPPTPPSTPRAAATPLHRKASGRLPVGLDWGEHGIQPQKMTQIKFREQAGLWPIKIPRLAGGGSSKIYPTTPFVINLPLRKHTILGCWAGRSYNGTNNKDKMTGVLGNM